MERKPGILEGLGEVRSEPRLTKALVTGAAGFIGSHLVCRLLREGYGVSVILRKNTDTWRIKNFLHRLEIVRADLRETTAVNEAIITCRPQVVFHLATHYAVEHGVTDVAPMIATNVLGTVNLLQATKYSGVRLFINASTCFVYGAGERPWSENDKTSPWNLYALTKLQAEEACSYYSRRHGVPTVSFRIFPPYGPGDHDRRLIPSAIRSFLEGQTLRLTTGEQKWDFVYIDDVVEAMVRSLNVPFTGGRHEVINIGTGRAVSVKDVILRIRDLLGSSQEPLWGDIPHREHELFFVAADTKKARESLRWIPETDILEEGLVKTIDWYRENRRGSNGDVL